MKLELTRRERAVGIALSATLVLLLVVACFGILRSRRTLLLQADHLRAAVDAITKERDLKAAAIAPFESLAERQLPNEEPGDRLSLLLRRIEAMTKAGVGLQGRRKLDPEAIARIREKLADAPGLDIEVGGLWQDAEALALAEELRSVFDIAKFKTRKLAQYVAVPNMPVGVAVYSKHELDQVLSEAIAQIFAELEQQPAQWLEDDEAGVIQSNERQPDLKIVVGHR